MFLFLLSSSGIRFYISYFSDSNTLDSPLAKFFFLKIRQSAYYMDYKMSNISFIL